MSHRTLARIGWALSALFALFMLGASATPKLLLDVGAETMADLGWAAAPVALIGTLELLCTLLYLVPATSVLGAVLMMAIFGGAMVTQMRAEMPLVSNQLFSLYLGVIMWAGLWLRDPVLRRLFPIRRATG